MGDAWGDTRYAGKGGDNGPVWQGLDVLDASACSM